MNTATNVIELSRKAWLSKDHELFGRIMGYDHPILRERMNVKYGWTEEKTSELFLEMKRFLFLCATNEVSLAPPEEVDEIWHNFILFTRDYADFCENVVGIFINHRPMSEAEKSGSDGTLVHDTLAIARSSFGDLSEHWNFKKMPGSCGDGVCGASTNCQD